MTTTRPDLVNLPELTNPTDEQTNFVVQDSGVNQKLSAQRTREFLGNQIGPTGPQGPQGVQGPQGPQGVQGPQGPAFRAISSSTATPTNIGNVTLVVTDPNHSFTTGNRVRAINSVTNFFEGQLTLSLDKLTFTIAADYQIGANTTNSWVISLAGAVGATGPQGPQGVQGPTGPSFKVTSVTTATPSNSATIPLVVNTSSHAFITGQRVIAVNAVNNFFEGVVTVVGGTVFVISADYNVGTTTASSWEIGLAGQKGATGPQGPQGVQGPTGPVMLVTSNSLATPDGVSLTTLIVNTNQHLFVQGLRVLAINTNSNYFEGTITNNVIGSTTFIIKQDSYAGGTAASSWNVVLTGKEGPQGPQGPINPFATTSTNIAGGRQGAIPIQSNTGTTAFIAPGTTGTILAWDSNTATWVSTGSISIGTAAVSNAIYSQNYTTSELTPNKYIGIVDYAGISTPSNVGVQASLGYNTNQERLTLGRLTVSQSDSSTATNIGALVVTGGVGIGANLTIGQGAVLNGGLRVDGVSTITNSTPSTSPTTGALQVTGGVGIGGDLNVAGEIKAQRLTIELTTVTTTLVTTDDIIKTTNNTNATSTVTGALQVTGGVGIGRDLYVGGSIYAIITTATNLAGGSAGKVPYQTGVGATGFITEGATGSVLVSYYNLSPVWQNTLTLSSLLDSSSTSTGALQVRGGVGIGGSLTVGGTINGKITNIAGGSTGDIPYQIAADQTGFIPIGSANYVLISNGTTASWGPATGIVAGSANTATNLANGQQFQIPYQTGGGTTGFEAEFTYNYITNTLSATNAVFVGTTDSLNITSGAVQISGGLGLAKNLNVGGNSNVTGVFTVSNVTSATSTQSGALVVSGGVGIGGDLYVGGGIVAQQLTIQYTTVTTTLVTTDDIIRTTNTSAAVSTQTGALQIAGGAGIGGDLHVGGLIYGVISTATFLQGGLPGSIPFQTATNITSFITRGATGTILVSRFNQEPVFQNTLTLAGTNSSISTATGALQVVGGVGIGGDVYVGGTIYGTITTATNLAGGALGSIPYQNASGVTRFIPIGTNGFILVSNGSTASWTAPTGLSAGSSNTATNIGGGAQYQIPYQTAGGVTAFESGFEYRYDIDTFSVTNVTVFGTGSSISSTTGALKVAGGVGIEKNVNIGGGTTIQGILTITNTTSATNTLTGALQVAGGASFQKDVYVWGSIYATTLVIDVTTVSTNFVVTDDVIQTNNTSNAISTATGALRVPYGGLSVGLDVWVGGLVKGTSTGSLYANTSTNLAGGTSGQIPFQTATGITTFTGPGVTGTVLVSRGANGGGPIFQNTLTLAGTTDATSTVTGAFQVVGGAGIGGNLHVGGIIYGFASVSGTITTATNLTGGTQGQIPFQSNPGTTAYFGPGTVGNVLVSAGTTSTGPLFQNTLTLAGTVAATNTLSGTLQVRGGVGIGGDVFIGGDLDVNGSDITSSQVAFNLLNANVTSLGFAGAATVIIIGAATGYTNVRNQFTVTNTTNAISSMTGALTVRGGAGIGQDLVVGGIAKAIANINSTSTNSGALQVTGGAGIAQNLVVGGNASIAGITTVTNNTITTSPTSGAFQVVGGVGIQGDLRVGGTIYGVAGVVGSITTASNIALGTAGQVPYQTAPNVTQFFGPGTGGDVLVSNGTNAPGYQNTLTLSSTNNASNTTTGALQVRGGVGIGGNVYIGQDLDIAGGDLTASTSTFNLLNATVTTLNLGQAGTAITVGATTGYTNVRNLFTLTNGTNATSSATGALVVSGGAGIGKDLYVGGGTYQIGVTTVTNTTNATNTQTGALQVRGGVGIGRDLWVGGIIYGSVSGSAASSSATFVVSTSGATTHYISFVDSNNSTLLGETFYTTASLSVTPSTGDVRIQSNTQATSTLTGAFTVTGGVGIGRDIFVGGGANVSGISTFTNVTSATSTLTGSLQVRGGVGVGGSMYLQGYLQVGFSAAAGYSTGTNGEIRATNEITAYYSSDANLKENIRLINDPITLINQIRGVYFDWKDDYIESRGGEDGFFVRKSDVGVIAQEVEKILPEIVATRDNGYKAVRYEKIVPLLIEAIKTLSAEIDEIKKKLN